MRDLETKTREQQNPLRGYFKLYKKDRILLLAAILISLGVAWLPKLMTDLETPVIISTIKRSDLLQRIDVKIKEKTEITKTTKSVNTDNEKTNNHKAINEADTKVIVSMSDEKGGGTLDSQQTQLPLQRINPNNAEVDELIRIGLPQYLSNNWVKYLQAGGQIHAKADALKLYGMNEELLANVERHFEWAQSSHDSALDENFKVLINSSPTEDWQRLRGIGPVLSERIIKFREKLGGFHSIEQVGLTYGISDSLFQSIKDQLTLDKTINKLAINSLNEKDLSNHPYISFKEARIIVLYRNSNGHFHTAKDLLKTEIVDELWLERIEPYLSFED